MTGGEAWRESPVRLTARALQVAVTFVSYGVTTMPAWVSLAKGAHTEANWDVIGGRLSACLWRLGPAFTKFGQLLATRRDLLPPGVCKALETGLARRRSTTDRGTFQGSIATVTRHERDGITVAVKVRRPGVARRLERDLLLVEAAAAVAQRVPGVRAPLLAITRELTHAVRGQCDFRKEASVLERFSRLERTLPVVFPHVLTCESDLITMTWLEGQYDTATKADPRRLAKQLMNTVFEMLFVEGLVHCDLHPGNWWVSTDGRLAVVDAGFAYELDRDMLDHFGEFFLGMAAGNGEVCAAHAIATTAADLSADSLAAFRQDITALIEDTAGRTAGDFSLTGFAARLFAIQRRHGAHSKPAFIFPFAALLAIEGQVKSLDPSINFQSLAGPIVLRGLIDRSRRRMDAASTKPSPSPPGG